MKNRVYKEFGELSQKISERYERWVYQRQAKRLFERAKRASVPFNEGGISAWQAADIRWLAIYLAEKSEDKDLVTRIKEEVDIFQGYDPLNSQDRGIKYLACDKIKRTEINTLEKMAEERLRLGVTERAIEYHAQAIELTKELNDSKLLKEIKTKFEKASKEMYSGN